MKGSMLTRTCEQLFRLSLQLYPAEFREQFADEMAAVFSGRLAETATGGWAWVLALAGRELSSVAGQAARERLAALRARPARLLQTASGPRLVLDAGWPVRLLKLLLAAAVVMIVGAMLFPIGFQYLWQRVETSPKVNEVALADLNGDGPLDAFIGVGRGGMPFPAYALYNDGAGRLGHAAQAIGKWPGHSVALGDLNGDERVDALLDITAGGIVVFFGQPEGWREYGYLAAPGPTGVMRLRPVVGDLNGDGRLDVFAAGCCGRPSGESPDTVNNPYLPPYSQVWLQTDGGRLRAAQQVGDAPSGAAALADLDGDGSLDAFLANGRALVEGWESGPPQANAVWLNDGQGNFRDSGQRLGQADSRAVALGDLNGDGWVDAVVGNNGPSEVWLNGGVGLFADSGQRLGSGLTEHVFLADLDGDGDLDLLEAGPAQARAWFNDGRGQFEPGRQRLRYGADDAVAVGDLDGDGVADVLVVGVTTARVLANDGRGRFVAGPATRYR
jgi:hypothetical protein